MADSRRLTTLRAAVREAFTENLGLKLTSLVIAIVLFAFTRGRNGESVQRTLEVALVARLPPQADRLLLSQLPARLRVTVRGLAPAVGRLRGDDLGPLDLDLSDGRPVAEVDRVPLALPAGVELVQVEPRRIALEWDTVVVRRVPVEVDFDGHLDQGLRLGTVTVLPAAVRVSGPSRALDALTAVRTLPVELGGLVAASTERRVRLEAPPSQTQFDPPGAVTVSFAVERELVERRFERVTVAPLGGALPRPVLRPTLLNVVLRGEPSVLASIEPSQLVPTVDLRELDPREPGAESLPVHLEHLPAGVTVVALEPPVVLVMPVR